MKEGGVNGWGGAVVGERGKSRQRVGKKDTFRELSPILFVTIGKNDSIHSGSLCSNAFFAHPTDGQDFSGEGDLARHSDVVEDGSAESEGEEGRNHGDSSRWAIFGCGSLGDMHVQGCSFEEAISR